jgi:hypothetical protein
MPVMNTQQAAVIDPVLSTYARGYRNQEFIADALFPRAMIPNRSMRQIRFGKEAFRMLNTRRAPGADKRRIQYGYASDPVALLQDALEGVVPIEHMEEAASVPGIDLAEAAIQMVMDVIDLNLEFDAATIARNAANYGVNNKVTLTGTARWTNAASNPQKAVMDAQEAIRRSIGRYANTLTLGPTAANALRQHQMIKDQFKYTGRDSITNDMLAAFFDVKRVVVGKAVFLPETAADTAMATDVWGDDAILAYVPEKGNNYQVPSYGYTYELTGYPQVQQPYMERSNDSWIYPIKAERRPILTGAEGGFLFTGAGLP